MDKKLVSILLPIYNGERTLESTVKSLLSQSYAHFELIACIDGTEDKSEDILNSFQDERIKIIKNPKNLGLAGTLNRLMHLTSPHSEYIAMAEQDDWYYPERLQKQVDVLNANADYGLVSGIAEHQIDSSCEPTLFPGILVKGGQYPNNYRDFFYLITDRKLRLRILA